MKRTKNYVINIISCNGATCVSVNNNDSIYYAQGVSSRILDIKRYKVR